MSPGEALQREIGADGLTRQERGMIDRELFPKRKHAGSRKKYVRQVRQRSNTVMCDLIAEDAKLLTLPMAAVLQHYTVGDNLKRGRARSHRLPARIAEKLHELKLTVDIKRSILGAIPPHRRATLERRARRASAGVGPTEKKTTRNTGEQKTEYRGRKPGTRRQANRIQGPNGPPGHPAGDGAGRAESDKGRGSGVPRRGFPK